MQERIYDSVYHTLYNSRRMAMSEFFADRVAVSSNTNNSNYDVSGDTKLKHI